MTASSIAITGASACCSLGEGREAILEAMLAGGVAIDEAPAIEGIFRDDAAERPVRAAQARERGPDVGAATDRAERILHRMTMAALAEAGLDPATLVDLRRRGTRIETIFGTTLGGMRHLGAALRTDDLDEYGRTTTATVVREALRGTGLPEGGSTISAACASGVSAVAIGATALLLGEADLVVAIAYDPISEFAFAGFGCLRLIAAGPQRPFSADREGMRVGEGYAVIVLERDADAARRGAAPLGRVLGWGAASDAHHLTQPAPDGAGAGRAIREAIAPLQAVGRLPDLVAAHATSTPANDAAEHAALRSALGPGLASVPVTALKSRIGHTLGAAGAVELAVVLAAMERGMLPSAAHADPDRKAFPDLDLVVGAPRTLEASRALVVSLGFGGADAALVVERGTAPDRVAASPPIEIDDERGDIVVTGVATLLPAEGATIVDEAAFAGLDDARAIRRLARFSVLVRAAGILATRDAGLDAEEIRAASAVVGTRFGAAAYTLDYYDELVRDGLGAGNPLYFAESVPNIGSAQLSLGLGIEGSTLSVSGTMLAAIEAIHLARRHLASGQSERAIVVVAEESHPRVEGVLRRLGLLDDRPLAEGAVAFVLERRRTAERRGAPSRATIVETGLVWPDGPGARSVVRAVRDAFPGSTDPDLEVLVGDGTGVAGRLLRAGLGRSRGRVAFSAPESVERQSVAWATRLAEAIGSPRGGVVTGVDPSGFAGRVRVAPASPVSSIA